MFNLITLETIENKTIVASVRMVGQSVVLSESDIKINEYLQGNVVHQNQLLLHNQIHY